MPNSRLGTAASRSTMLVSVRCHRGGAYSVMARAAHTRGEGHGDGHDRHDDGADEQAEHADAGLPFAVFHTARVKKPMPWLWNARRLRSRRK